LLSGKQDSIPVVLMDPTDGPYDRESIAIMIYLADKYDVNHKISASNESEKYQQLQWMLFQASGQGCVCLVASDYYLYFDSSQSVLWTKRVVPTLPS
jgi:glutathione S-transferase